MKPDVVAHRGLARLYPENSLSGVLAAAAAGLRHIEIDVQLSLDRVPLVYHDATLERVSGARGDVRDLKWSQLKGLRVPEAGRFGAFYKSERLCTLAALAKALQRRRYRGVLFVELKEESLLRFGRASMLAAVDRALGKFKRQAVLISFDEPVLELARRATRYKLGVVLRDVKRLRSPFMRALDPEHVFCDVGLLPKKGQLKPALGLGPKAKLTVYEVPALATARELGARGADLIETFSADSLRQELARYR